jgi:hypothetical protein
MVQVGCRAGRLEKFAREGTGAEVEVVTDPQSNLTHSVIRGRLCNLARPKGWAEKNSGMDLPRLARQEARVKVDVICVLGPGATLDDLGLTLESVEGPLLGTVCVVHNTPDVHYGRLRQWMQARYGERPFFTTLLATGAGSDYYQAVDHPFGKIKTLYYLAIPAGEAAPEGLFEWLDKEVNDNLARFSLVHPPEGDWYIAQRGMHDALGGNSPSLHEYVEPAPGGGEEVKRRAELPNFPAKAQYLSHVHARPHMVCQYGG